MFVIYGTRTARIKKYPDHQENCKSCKAFNLETTVYRDYFHLYFLPFCPVSQKKVETRCLDCGAPYVEEELRDEYRKKSRTPIYLYTIPILFVSLVIFLIYGNLNTQKEKALFVADPKIGDVYTVRIDTNNATTYFFLRVADIQQDTITAYHSNLEYHQFISEMNEQDFFVKEDALYFTKNELKQMLEKMQINSVERAYDNESGFNRIK